MIIITIIIIIGSCNTNNPPFISLHIISIMPVNTHVNGNCLINIDVHCCIVLAQASTTVTTTALWVASSSAETPACSECLVGTWSQSESHPHDLRSQAFLQLSSSHFDFC